ncbi:MAG: hypothetical protein KDE27_07210 [Planctomycetes bacterium]|nr:hypothetical protein [Planctomycetota bacterium]
MTFRSRLVLTPLALAAACAAPNPALDLATNDRIYIDVPFRSRIPGDRDLFVAPLEDGRSAAELPAEEGGFPISYGSDQVWERPVREMVDEILARQLADSALFRGVAERVGDDTVVLAPTLVSFTTGALECVAGARAFAEVGLRLRVFGPVEASGKRPLLLDETVSERQITPPSLRPVSPYLLAGSALRATMQKSLATLDTSNVGRSFVPEVAAAAPVIPELAPPAAPADK